MQKRMSIVRTCLAVVLVLSSFQAARADQAIGTTDECAGVGRVIDENVTATGYLGVCSGGLPLFPVADDYWYGGFTRLYDSHQNPVILYGTVDTKFVWRSSAAAQIFVPVAMPSS